MRRPRAARRGAASPSRRRARRRPRGRSGSSPADAELGGLDGADGGARRERDLDRAVEVAADVDAAGLAVHAALELAERRRRRRRAAARRAEELPAEIRETGPRRVQQELQRLAPAGPPGVRQLVRAQPGERLLVAALEEADERLDQPRVEPPSAQLLRAAPQPLAAAGREPGRALRLLLRRREPVVRTEGPREADAAEQADLHPGRDDAEQVARPDADLVVEARPTVAALLEPRLDAELGDRAADEAPHDAEPLGPQPFERLLLPFDRHSEPPQAEPPPRVPLRSEHLHGRYAGVAVEAIRVGDERPQCGRRGRELVPPVEAELLHRAKR